MLPDSNDSKKSRNVGGEETDIIPGLPHEIALECLDRVPRLLHPHLAAVSKLWLRYFASQVFSTSRSSLPQGRGLLTGYLYARVEVFDHERRFVELSQPRFWAWNLQEKVCLPLPRLPVTPQGNYTVASGRLFFIRGWADDSSDVWAYNPFINRWDSVPPMKISRCLPMIATIGEKIYVFGGCSTQNPDWAEVYDPVVGHWTSLSVSSGAFGDNSCGICVVANGKAFGMCYEGLGFVFDPSTPSFTTVSREAYSAHPTDHIYTLFSNWNLRQSTAVVKGTLFTYFQRKLRGYDFENHQWNVLQGTGAHLRSRLRRAILVNVEEKLCLIWKNRTELTFACLDIYKHQGLLRCKVLWCHSVVSTHPFYVSHCLSISESYNSE